MNFCPSLTLLALLLVPGYPLDPLGREVEPSKKVRDREASGFRSNLSPLLLLGCVDKDFRVEEADGLISISELEGPRKNILEWWR